MQPTIERPHFSIYLLGLVIMLLPLDSALSGLLGGVSLIDYLVVLFLFIHIISNSNVIFKKDKNIIVILPLLYATISIIWSMNKRSLSNLMYISYFILFIVLLNTRFNQREKVIITKSIFFSGLLLIVFTVIFGEFYKGRLSININGYIDPNYFCTSFIIVFGLLLYNIHKSKDRILSCFMLIALIIIVVLSGSRGSLVTILLELMAYIVFLNKKHLFKMLLFIVLLFIVLLILYNILPENIVGRFNIFNSIKTDGGSGRLEIWKNMLTIYVNGSFISKFFGYGRESSIVLYKNMTGINYTPHNLYIKILLEFGIVGLFLVIIGMINILKWTIKNDNAFLFAILVGISVGSLFLDMDNTRVIWFIIFLLSKDNIICIGKCNKTGDKYVIKHSCASV